MKRLLSITGLALLGVAVAVVITMAASSLSNQSIGISEEPLDSGAKLAPREETTTARSTREPSPSRTTDADETPATTSTSGDNLNSGSDGSSGDNSESGREDSGNESGGTGSEDSGRGISGSGSDDSGSDD